MDEAPDPRPVLSSRMAAELLWASWPRSTRPSGPAADAVDLALTLVAASGSSDASDAVSGTFDAAVHVLRAGDPDAAALVVDVFVPALLCVASHRGEERDDLVGALPAELWQIWHRRREELEARSETRDARRVSSRQPIRGVDSATLYRAENGKLVPAAASARPWWRRR